VSGKLWSRQVLPVTLTRPALGRAAVHKGEEHGAIKGIEPIVFPGVVAGTAQVGQDGPSTRRRLGAQVCSA
jgi:hypothetical protein